MSEADSPFSVVIPMYDKEATVARAIRSVLNQTVQDFEVLVVNDGSTDNGPLIVESIGDPRIKMIHQENQGVSAARNRGISEAQNELIAFLDADDEWMPEFLMTVQNLITSHPDCGLYGTRYFYGRGDGRLRPAVVRGLADGYTGVLDNYFHIASRSDPPIWSGAVCLRKACLLKVGGFPGGVNSGEDLLTWARISGFTSIAYSMNCCSVYHPSVPDTYPELPCRVPSDPDIVGRELHLLLTEISPVKRDALREYCAHWHKMRASSFLSLGMKWKARREISLGLNYNCNFKLIVYSLLSLLPVMYLKRIFRKLTID